MGSDPTTQIEQLAKRMETKCRPMSMGQGQEVHARKLLASAGEEVGIYCDQLLKGLSNSLLFCRVIGHCFKTVT